MKNEKYHAVRTVPKSNRKIPRCQKSSEIVKRGKVDITQIHGSSLYWLSEGTSLKVSELNMLNRPKTINVKKHCSSIARNVLESHRCGDSHCLIKVIKCRNVIVVQVL